MVLRAGKDTNVGGHIASFASAATLYDVGYNHFWHAPSENHGGDLVFVQGHSSPGVYSRAFLLGRLTENQLDNFRQEVGGEGISSYPHPWLMPDFWQFPTVSMGLGPIMAIYQARFMKYLQARGIAKTDGRKVWAFLATPDGEVAIESLRIGDLVLTASGEARPIIWIGHRTLDMRRRPNPEKVWPICVSAGAFGDNRPSRDLLLSPATA